MSSVYQAFHDIAKQYSHRPFVHIPAIAAKGYQDQAVDLYYGEALSQIDTVASQYDKAGFGLGHRVALVLENRDAFFIHWLALNKLGCSVVPVNAELSEEEMAYLLGNSETCLVVCLEEKQDILKRAIALETLQIPVISPQLDKLNRAKYPRQQADASEQSECALLYTSGSTGKPKGCMLSNEYFLESGKWYRDLGGLCQLEPGSERLITPLPLVHMNAMACSTMGMIMTGGCIIQLDRFHPSSWWKTVRESQATVIHYLGVMPAILLNLDANNDDFSQQIKFAFGAGVNPKHHQPFEQRFGFPLIEAWAMTESGTAGCIIANHEPRHIGSCCFGKASNRVEVKLIDDDGEEVAQGEPGELLVRAAGSNPRKGFFSGYFKNPKATEEAWQGGWLNTGDVVRLGDDFSYHFVDRKKNVIRRSGENISALEVEANLVLNPLIDQVAVSAVPDDIRGDEVMACVVLKDNTQASEETAKAILAESLRTFIYYKTPGYISFVDALPLTASQKPQRAEIKKLGRQLVETDNCYDLRHLKRRQQ